MSASNYRQNLHEAVNQLLWRQWVAMGVAGYSDGKEAPYVLDPEALVLFSSSFCRYDQRLYDLMASWMITYSRLLNPTRLKALCSLAKCQSSTSLAYLAALCAQEGDIRWRNAARISPEQQEKPNPLFINLPDGSALYCREADICARKYGLLRNPFIRQNKIRTQIPHSLSTLLLSLRGIVGVTARAEVILLLMESPCSIQQLSNRSGFVRSAVKVVLDELILSNFATAIGKGGRNMVYTLTDKDLFSHFTKGHSVSFPRWLSIYGTLEKLLQIVSMPGMEKVSDTTFQGEVKHLFRESLRPELIHCGIRELENLTENSIFDLPNILNNV